MHIPISLSDSTFHRLARHISWRSSLSYSVQRTKNDHVNKAQVFLYSDADRCTKHRQWIKRTIMLHHMRIYSYNNKRDTSEPLHQGGAPVVLDRDHLRVERGVADRRRTSSSHNAARARFHRDVSVRHTTAAVAVSPRSRTMPTPRTPSRGPSRGTRTRSRACRRRGRGRPRGRGGTPRTGTRRQPAHFRSVCGRASSQEASTGHVGAVEHRSMRQLPAFPP